ncbi:MAG: hypothetical protein ACRC2K_12590, partial [Clostridium sp.]
MSNEFLKKINLEIRKREDIEDKEIKIIRFQFFRKSNLLKVKLRVRENLVQEEEEWLKKLIVKNLGIEVNIEILVIREVVGIDTIDILNNHWLDVVGKIIKVTPMCRNVLLSEHKELVDDKIVIRSGASAIVNYAKKKKVEE